MKRILWKKGFAGLLIFVFVSTAIIPTGFTMVAEASEPTASSSYLDKLVFGDITSETEHNFFSESSKVITNETTGDTARVAVGIGEVSKSDLVFTMQVEPYEQNYITFKYWGSEINYHNIVLYVDGEQIEYRSHGDYDVIYKGARSPIENRYWYSTGMIPVNTTYGKNEITITARTFSGSMEAGFTAESVGIYSAYTHIQAYLDVSDEVQGVDFTYNTEIVRQGLTAEEQQALIDEYVMNQENKFWSLYNKLDNSPSENISITRYVDELKLFANCIHNDVIEMTPEQKTRAIELVFQSIDNYVKLYYGNNKSVGYITHQSDWGGYYSALGEALYLIDQLIYDDAVYGKARFQDFLNDNIVINTTDGENSISGTNPDGSPITRFQAWERCLKAAFDFARSRLSYIYNQVYYTYEGAWKSFEGLRVIGSDIYEMEGGKQRSHRILLETLGEKPFYGEEVLTDGDGRNLNLDHDLFKHDTASTYTSDCLNIVMKGLAKSKLDAEGNQVRVLDVGKYYTTMTEAGLTRENTYVGNYGESANYLPEYFFKTLNHAGDEILNDTILKLALKNINARSYTRYPSVDADGKRVMIMEQVIDERNYAHPGKQAYAALAQNLFHFATLEWFMTNHAAQYAGDEWDVYWEYAANTTGFMQQALLDNQFFNNFSTTSTYNLPKYFYYKETYDFVTNSREALMGSLYAGAVHPFTNFDYYSTEEISLMLNGQGTGQYDQFAWVDIDNLYVAIRDESENLMLMGSLYERNRGMGSNGRLHVLRETYENVVQIATNNIFQWKDYWIRMNDVSRDYMIVTENDVNLPFALTGEICPIAYQPGLGTIFRDNFEADHVYSGYADLSTSRYGKYFMVFNTTRAEFGNENTFTVELPSDYVGDTVLDMVSGELIPVIGGCITISPKTAYILKITNEIEIGTQTPAHVDYAMAFPGYDESGAYARIIWKTTDGGQTYKITRSKAENGSYELVAEGVTETSYIDRAVETGETYYYKVSAVNNGKEGWTSYRAELSWSNMNLLENSWMSSVMTSAKEGAVAISGSSITVTGASGNGLGYGDDFNSQYREESEFFADSLQFIYQETQGNFEISLKLNEYSGNLTGLMIRDEIDNNTRYTRYLSFGANSEGKLVLQNRTRDSRYNNATLQSSSPLTVNIGNYNVAEYPYIKLSRDVDLHIVNAYVSDNGTEWCFVGSMGMPLPETVYAGISVTGEMKATDVSLIALEDLYEGGTYPLDQLEVFTPKDEELQHYTVQLKWTPPMYAVAYKIERSTNGENYVMLEDNYSSFGSYTDTDSEQLIIHDGAILFYRVTPLNQLGIAGEGKTISVTVHEPPVIDIVANVDNAYASNNRSGSVEDCGVMAMLDNNITTFTDIRNTIDGTNGTNSWVVYDFGIGQSVRLDLVKMYPRNDGYYTRIAGTHIEGSNDGENWVDLTENAVATQLWQVVKVLDNVNSYQFIKVTNHGSWFGNIGEVRLHGEIIGGELPPGDLTELGELINYANNALRLNDIYVQGSNDNVNWVPVTTKVSGVTSSTLNTWFVVEVTDTTEYRYFRLIKDGTKWYCNVAEVLFFGTLTFEKTEMISELQNLYD